MNQYQLKKNKLFTIAFIWVCLATTACTRSMEKENQTQLTTAAQLMETDPQQASLVLSEVQPSLLNKDDYTYYTLLKIRAWNLTDKNIGGMDTLALPAREYFTAKQDAAKAAYACFIMAKVYEVSGNIPQALHNYLWADDWAKKVNYNIPHFFYSAIPYNISALCFYNKEYNESIAYLDKALSFIDKERGKYTAKLYALEFKGSNYAQLQNIDNALLCYDEALKIAIENRDMISGNRILSNKNVLLYTTQQYSLAQQQAQQLLSTIAPQDTLNLTKTYITLGYIYNNNNQLDSALLYAQKAEKLSSNSAYYNNNEYVVQLSLLSLLTDVLNKKGLQAKASDYRQQYDKIKWQHEAVRQIQQESLKHEQQMSHEFQQENRTIIQSNRNVVITLQKQKLITLLVAMGIFTALIGVSVMYYIKRRERKLIAEISIRRHSSECNL